MNQLGILQRKKVEVSLMKQGWAIRKGEKLAADSARNWKTLQKLREKGEIDEVTFDKVRFIHAGIVRGQKEMRRAFEKRLGNANISFLGYLKVRFFNLMKWRMLWKRIRCIKNWIVRSRIDARGQH